MTLYAYPIARKAKSMEICRAFVEGCCGALAVNATHLFPGPAFFYGVDESNVNLWREAKARGNYYYCDNSYFDPSRQSYFRITRDALQHSGRGESDGSRFAALGITIKPWRDGGKHVVVCPQSVAFMKLVVGQFDRDWFVDAIAVLNAHRPRIPIKVREWDRDKTALAATLGDDLKDALALVTWSSAAAITAILEGVPAVVLSDDCAAKPMSSSLYRLDEPRRPAREIWAGVLADNQWTLDEMRSGFTWNAMQGGMLNAA